MENPNAIGHARSAQICVDEIMAHWENQPRYPTEPVMKICVSNHSYHIYAEDMAEFQLCPDVQRTFIASFGAIIAWVHGLVSSGT
jgi:hypothetical protein